MSAALLQALGCAWFATLSVASAEPPPATIPPGELQRCARLSVDAERLACYDQLAGRAPQSAPAPLAHGAGGAAPAPAAPAAAAGASAGVPAAAAAAGASGGAPAAAANAATPSAPVPGQSFGLYSAEHPKPAVANSLEAPITALGQSASGHTTVSLEGGAVWELDEPDPLLRVGDVVTISRAALGSYLMHTPTRRTHRVHRLH